MSRSVTSLDKTVSNPDNYQPDHFQLSLGKTLRFEFGNETLNHSQELHKLIRKTSLGINSCDVATNKSCLV